MLGFLALAALLLVGGVALARSRSGASASGGAVPTGTGTVPAGSGAPMPAADSDPATGLLASALNTALHTYGGASAEAKSALGTFQAAVGLPPSGAYDSATAAMLAHYVTNPPSADTP